jgi:hypothetical protein
MPRVPSDSSDVALAWSSCHWHQADRISTRITPSLAAVACFNPSSDAWAEHVEWADDARMGQFGVGRVMIEDLKINHARRLKSRQVE